MGWFLAFGEVPIPSHTLQMDAIGTLLSQCLAANISPEQRQLAHLNLEQFKQRPDVLERSLELYFAELNSNPQPRDFVLHFALRTCAQLVRMFYPTFPPAKSQLVKQQLLLALDSPVLGGMRLVESTAIVLGGEILKQDAEFQLFFDELIAKYKQTGNQTVSKLLCDFSESLFEDDDDLLTTTRRSSLSKYMNSQFGPQVLPLALLQVEYELSVMNNEVKMAQALVLASECLRWNPPFSSASQEQNALALFERCCENPHFPSTVIQSAFVALKHYAWGGKINHSLVYALVHRQVVSRPPTQYHNPHEFQLANELFLTLVQRHHASLPKSWQLDMEKMTALGLPGVVLNDYLGAWRELIAKKPSGVAVSQSWMVTLVKLCLVQDDHHEDGDEDGDEPFESQKPLLVKELVKQHGEAMLVIVLDALQQQLSHAQQWFLVEGTCNGMSDKQLDLVRQGSKGKFPELCVQLLDWVFKSPPTSAQELKVLHSSHALFETKTAFLSKALQFYVDCAVDVRLPALVKKRAACHLLDALRKKSSKDLFILPSLVQRVSSVFPTLIGPERFVLLECILVAGHALPTAAERVELTRQVLAEPFQTLNETGPEVLQQRFLAVDGSGSKPKPSKPWDQRGYFVDVEYLPASSKRFIVSLMTISTCAKDGQLTEQMWQQLLPIALACLDTLNGLWVDADSPLLVVHPVDCRMLFGSRVAETMETFMDRLVQFGESSLGVERMAVSTLLSCVRTCCLELVKEAQTKFPALVSPAVVRQLFQRCDGIETRHLAMLLTSVLLVPSTATAERVFLHQICQHVATQRLSANQPPPAQWLVRIPPTCLEFVEEVNLAARRLLELAFVRFLAALPVEVYAELQFQWLLERMVFGEDQAVRLSVGAIMERYMGKTPDSALSKLCLPACVQAFQVHTDTSKMLVGEVFADAVCRLAYRTPVRDFHLRTKPGGNNGKKKGNNNQAANGPSLSALQAVLPVHLVNKFAQDVEANATSEKTFRQCAVDLLKSMVTPAADALAKPTGDVLGKKKNKNKKKKGTPELPQEPTAAAGGAVPPWHHANDSRDLGMLALFGDNDDDL